MRNRDSVSRFWEGGKRGSVEQQDKERRDQSEHCDKVFGSTGNTQQTINLTEKEEERRKGGRRREGGGKRKSGSAEANG